ncbi:MAG: hypothetical protein M1833_003596 [Piccolia ochrophora]|nr:MAG: hypothetical protein M1833_003596 [Piccolia ochrophora]
MSGESIATRNTVGSQMRALAQRGRPKIEISLKNHDDLAGTTYTTLDTLEGEVAITAQQDARFDEIGITFEGSTKTYVEKLSTVSAAANRVEASHNFLKLSQPIDESTLPQPRIAEAGKTYRFPFTFVVPEQLLPHICVHRCESNQVHDAHLRLPPSLGEGVFGIDGSIHTDDLAPVMTRISYAIKVRVTRFRDSDNRTILLADKSRKVHIVPAFEEEAPVEAVATSSDFVLRQEKKIRKGLFKGKLGALTMQAAQTKSLRLAPPKAIAGPVTTMAMVEMRFDPATPTTVPPKFGLMAARIKASTYYAGKPMSEFPSRDNTVWNIDRGLYQTSLQLSSRCVESAKWTMHDPSESTAPSSPRRGSVFSTSSTLSGTSSSSTLPEPSSRYQAGSPFYTARILVPIALPKKKFLPPTFHSCLVARTYQLELALALHTPSTSLSTINMQLRLPIQVSAAGNLPTNSMAADAEAQVDAFFRPRSFAPPAADLIGTSDIMHAQIRSLSTASTLSISETMAMSAPSSNEQQQQQLPEHMRVNPINVPPTAPPGYSFFSGASHGVPVRIPSPVGISPGCG